VCDDAEFSNDGLERLWLSRAVERKVGAPLNGHVGLIIGLNPSRAGAAREDTDHTITKEIEFSRRWGWSGFWKVNLFTCIETYSAKLKNLSFETAVGMHGSAVLQETIPLAPAIVVCWGAAVPKLKRHRISAVCEMIRVLKQPTTEVRCFGLSKDGFPVHPLRLAYDTPLVPYELPEPRSRRDD
jgi:hypothetical protein